MGREDFPLPRYSRMLAEIGRQLDEGTGFCVLRGLPIEEMRRNLSYIIETCQKHGARVLLAGMKITPNLGREYAEKFENLDETDIESVSHETVR
jgi:hypothetical protein